METVFLSRLLSCRRKLHMWAVWHLLYLLKLIKCLRSFWNMPLALCRISSERKMMCVCIVWCAAPNNVAFPQSRCSRFTNEHESILWGRMSLLCTTTSSCIVQDERETHRGVQRSVMCLCPPGNLLTLDAKCTYRLISEQELKAAQSGT